MLTRIKDALKWVPSYLARDLLLSLNGSRSQVKHVYFCICDHFEPYWNRAGDQVAKTRLNRWLNEWPMVADDNRDSFGNRLPYSFFYPEEEYNKDDIDALAKLCHAGYGEVEIHLHHHDDNPENLKHTLLDFKHRLHEVHGLLPVNERTGKISYAFIHGNWCLNNCRPDGCWCGVDDETSILLETGCYADLTFPSAPSPTQPRKVNSLYYVKPTPGQSAAHEIGDDLQVGGNEKGLLMVQGPLGFAWGRRKWGIVPRIENSGLMLSMPINKARFHDFMRAHVHVKGASEHVFVKLYAHGTQEDNLKMFFDDGGGRRLLSGMREYVESLGAQVHFVSARQMVNTILAIQRTDSSLNNNAPYSLKF